MSNASEPELSIYSLFERRAAEIPDKIAVIDAEGETSYSALAERSAIIASHLARQKIRSEEPIGVLMRRRAELMAVLLGIWKAGGAYIPFDHDDPPERIARMLVSSGCRRVIGDPEQLERLSSTINSNDSEPVALESIEAIGMEAAAVDDGYVAPGGSRLAYLLFTSGSTGEPKAVEVEHRNVAALLDAAKQLIDFSASDRYLAVSTIAFDASITELFLPLVTGASLVLRDRSLLLEPRRLADEIRRYAVTVFQTGPAVWSVILERCPDFPKVRVAITHGEAVVPELACRICDHGESTWNLYGPTETTVWACGQKLSSENTVSPSPISVPIGKPLAHVSTVVMDEDGRPAAEGDQGELWIGGPGVTRGYRGNSALTSEKFRTIDGVRHYRSGDIVSRDAHGVLHYFGRDDDQMKIRGVRIEPGEIEAALLKHQAVAQAAATWFESQTGRKAIVAAIVLEPGSHCTESQLHAAVLDRLPRQMIPSRYLFVPWLPMTISGKIDRRALRASMESVSSGHMLFSEPHGEEAESLVDTEATIARIWKNVLQLDDVRANTNFFLSGGDSLTAVQMLVEIEQQFGIDLSPHLAFEAPTLTELAARVTRAVEIAEEDPGADYIFPVVREGDGPPLFFCHVDLVLARRDLWTVPCPLYAIVYWARGSGFIKARSIPELAARHVEGIRAVQPSGPYRLAGYSLGGLIAYEIAQQLDRAGEKVEMLFLLDPLEPKMTTDDAARKEIVAGRTWRQKVRMRWRKITGWQRSHSWQSWMANAFALPAEWRIYSPLHWLHYHLVDQHLRRPTRASKMFFPKNRWRAFELSASRIMDQYTAEKYRGRCTLIAAEDHVTRSDIWRFLLPPDVTIHKVPHDHTQLFRQPALAKWMDILTGVLFPH